MIKWKRIEPGNYESADRRFCICKTWNRIYGDHWKLRDMKDPDRYKGTYIKKTLGDCKQQAEDLLSMPYTGG